MEAPPAPPPPPANGALPPPKPLGFFRHLFANQKQGLGLVVLSASCLALSVNLLHQKQRIQRLQDENASIKKEIQELRATLSSVQDVVSETAGVYEESPFLAPPKDVSGIGKGQSDRNLGSSSPSEENKKSSSFMI